ncbi:MAG: ATP-binding protein [Candidatus Doudnabacteria bacterium]|nr:ATP-binding protein [Candidatus Doudnabacteria bacterium]
MLHIIMGLPGSGKSTATKLLAERLHAEVINTDILHGLLFPQGERTETGDFTPEQLAEIYRSMRPLAYYLSKVAPESHIIFEGSFRFKSQRDFITQLLIENGIKYQILLLELDEKIAEERITNRHEKEGAPDTFEDYLKIKSVFERPTAAFEIDNTGKVEDLAKHLDDYIESLQP